MPAIFHTALERVELGFYTGIHAPGHKLSVWGSCTLAGYAKFNRRGRMAVHFYVCTSDRAPATGQSPWQSAECDTWNPRLKLGKANRTKGFGIVSNGSDDLHLFINPDAHSCSANYVLKFNGQSGFVKKNVVEGAKELYLFVALVDKTANDAPLLMSAAILLRTKPGPSSARAKALIKNANALQRADEELHQRYKPQPKLAPGAKPPAADAAAAAAAASSAGGDGGGAGAAAAADGTQSYFDNEAATSSGLDEPEGDAESALEQQATGPVRDVDQEDSREQLMIQEEGDAEAEADGARDDGARDDGLQGAGSQFGDVMSAKETLERLDEMEKEMDWEDFLKELPALLDDGAADAVAPPASPAPSESSISSEDQNALLDILNAEAPTTAQLAL